jgi:hypothetical protein
MIYNQSELSKEEFTYIFYGLPKIHKHPMTLWPVVSTSGSFLAIFSVWLDYKMKELLPLVQSHIKNSTSLIQDLKTLTIPEGALLFTADATSMYTNIDTQTGVSAINKSLLTNQLPNQTIPQDIIYGNGK